MIGIMPALDYLVASNRQGLGDDVPAFVSGALNAAGRQVVVIGGGDTAMDCVRTAVRQGAKSVKCLYRRDRGNMPGSQREVKTVSFRSTRSATSRHMNESDAFGRSTPGSRPASHRIWKPLQIPSTRPPAAAKRVTASMTGANRAIAPQRR